MMHSPHGEITKARQNGFFNDFFLEKVPHHSSRVGSISIALGLINKICNPSL